jgi:hypothetical protein
MRAELLDRWIPMTSMPSSDYIYVQNRVMSTTYSNVRNTEGTCATCDNSIAHSRVVFLKKTLFLLHLKGAKVIMCHKVTVMY